ncbi:MAG: YhfC family intramembrane metalloprotease [Methanoregulaceae archaeon]|nr:YhfC family intramembrane metalloprotease [Methanoregulaceae archaeon]
MDPLVVATFIIVAALEILVPIVLGYLIVKKYSISWKVFGLGALGFIIVQIIHTPLVLVIQQPLLSSLREVFPDGTIALAAFSLVLGFLAGIFEEPARYIIFRWIFPRLKIPLTRDRGLLFGAGWGGVESIFVAILLLLTLVSYLYAPLLTEEQLQATNASIDGTLTQEQIQQILAQNEALMQITPFDILPGLAERMMTIIHHLAWTVMVLAAVIFSRHLLLVLAIIWHTGIDAFAVYLAQTSGIITAESAIFVSTLIAVVYLFWQWRRMGLSSYGQKNL